MTNYSPSNILPFRETVSITINYYISEQSFRGECCVYHYNMYSIVEPSQSSIDGF